MEGHTLSKAPLLPEEVPEEFHQFFVFEEQWVGNVYGKSGTLITRICSECSERHQTSVSMLRADGKRGRKMKLPKCPNCKGRTVTKEGYVWIRNTEHPNAYNGRYVPEHVLVMEESLGRYLNRDSESVHHINGDRGDNRLENLQLRNKFHGRGQKWSCGDCGSHNILPLELD